MKALRGRIPRAFPDHRRVEAQKYRHYVEAVEAHWGPLPAVAQVVVREAGRAAVELERLGMDLEAARRGNRRGDASRVRRQQFMLREQLGRLERRIEELAGRRTGQTADPLADVKRAVEAARKR
jgi:hypothetical protein